MNHKLFAPAMLLAVFFLLLAGNCQAHEQHLPVETVACLEWNGSLLATENSSTAELWQNPELQRAEQMLKQVWHHLLAKVPPTPLTAHGYQVKDYLALLYEDWSLALLPASDEKMPLAFVVSVSSGEKIHGMLSSFYQQMMRASAQEFSFGPGRGQKFRLGRQEVYTFRQQDKLYIASELAALEQVLQPESKLAKHPNYQTSQEMLSLSGKSLFSLFLHFEPLVNQLPAQMQQKFAALGVKDWKALAMRVWKEDELISRLALFAPGQKRGLTKILALQKGNPKPLLQMVPAELRSYAYLNLPLSSLLEQSLQALSKLKPRPYQQVKGALNQLKQMGWDIQQDFLEPLSGEMFAFTPTATTLHGASYLLVGLKKQAQLEDALLRLAEKGNLTVQTVSYQGREIFFLLAPMGKIDNLMNIEKLDKENPPVAAVAQYYLNNYYMALQPCFYREGDILVFSGLVQNLKDFIDHQPQELLSLEISPQTGYTSWSNGKDILVSYNTLLPILHFFEGSIREFGIPLDCSALPRAKTLAPLATPSQAQWQTTEQGIVIHQRQSLLLNFYPNVVTMTGVSGVLAAMLLPALKDVQTKARKTLSLSNLRTIGTASMLYQMEYGELPPLQNPDFFITLYQKGYIDNPSVFSVLRDSESSLSPSGDKAEFPIDYEVRTAPLPSNADVHDYFVWSKPGVHPSGRAVLFADGHVEFVPEEVFLEEVAAITEQKKK